MEIINQNNQNVETIEIDKSKVNVDFIKKKTQAKTFRGYLNGCIIKTRGNIEMEFLFRELLNKFNFYYPQRIVKTEIEIISGWKGKGEYSIFTNFDEDVVIRYPLKDKETKEVTYQTKTIPKDNVNKMLSIIRNLKLNKKYICYEIVKLLGYEWKNDVWKNRSKVYFLEYYFPIKCVEAMRIIKYSGRGEITRIK